MTAALMTHDHFLIGFTDYEIALCANFCYQAAMIKWTSMSFVQGLWFLLIVKYIFFFTVVTTHDGLIKIVDNNSTILHQSKTFFFLVKLFQSLFRTAK